MLNIINVSKSYGKNLVLENVSLEFIKPEIIALVGENGSGKTTFFNIICGLTNSSKGTVKLADNLNVSGLIEYPKFFSYMTGKENLNVLPNVNKQKAIELVNRFGLTNDINKKVRKYSLGMKQKLALIFVLSNQSQIVLLDEPTNALDPKSVEIMKEVLLEEKEKGRLIIISSHNLYFIDRFADKIYFLKNKNIQPVNNCFEEYVFLVEKFDDCLIKLKESNLIYRINRKELYFDSKTPISDIIQIFSPFNIISFTKSQPLSNLYLEVINEIRN